MAKIGKKISHMIIYILSVVWHLQGATCPEHDNKSNGNVQTK